MYLATKAEVDPLTTAVAECFQVSRVIDRSYGDPWIAIWTPARPLRLLNLASTWTLRAGDNQALCAGDRRIAKQWGRAIYEQIEPLDGLQWPSSVLGAGLAVALYQAAEDVIPARLDLHRPLADPALASALARSATAIGYALA